MFETEGDADSIREATEPTEDIADLRLHHVADLEGAYDDPARVGALAGLIEALRDDRALVLGAGDNTALGVLSLRTDAGRGQARPFFETVAPVADTFGNHDLDRGPAWAFEWADSVPTTYLCANLAGPGSGRVPDATVVERGGERVGITGVAHPNTPELGGAVDDLEFTDPVAAAGEALDALSAVDHAVVLSHCGERDAAVAAGVDADVVLGGHLHDRHVERVDGTLVVRTAGGGGAVSAVRLGEEPTVAFHEVDVDGDGDDGPFHEDLAAVYRRRRGRLGLDEVVARVEDPITRTERDRFRGESVAGNFAADAFRAAAEATVGLFPAGALRTGPPLAGDVTVGDVAACCPFDGRVLEVELDGDALGRVLEAAAVPHPGDRGWVRFHVSGMTVVWTEDEDLERAMVDGDPLDPDRTYRVATSAYVADIDGFGPIDRSAVVAEHAPQWRALVDHARDGGLDVETDGRIRRVPV